jgi:hypothetical protein
VNEMTKLKLLFLPGMVALGLAYIGILRARDGIALLLTIVGAGALLCIFAAIRYVKAERRNRR